MIESWLIFIVGVLYDAQGKTKTAFCFKLLAIAVGIMSVMRI